MIDYTPYVVGVYSVAVVIYGILIVKWQRGLKEARQQLSERK